MAGTKHKITLKLVEMGSTPVEFEIDSATAISEIGSFGILPGHEAMLAALRPGTALVCKRDGKELHIWPHKPVLSYRDPVLSLVCVSYRSDEVLPQTVSTDV